MGGKQTFDGRRVTMGLMGPLDLYRKLRWESKMIDQLAIADGGGAIYCALNAAISAWQLGDWMAVALAHDQRWPLAAAHLGATKMQTKQDLQAEMRKCDALVACQQIATAGKHLNIEQGTFRDGFSADYYVDYHWIEPETEDGEGVAVRKAALCTQGKRAQHGKPHGVVGDDQPYAREGWAGRDGVTERLVVPTKPGNAGGGKEPWFKTDARRSEDVEIGNHCQHSCTGLPHNLTGTANRLPSD